MQRFGWNWVFVVAVLLLGLFASSCYSDTYSFGLSPPPGLWATLEEQLAEKEALLAIKRAFNNHPYLDSWVEASVRLTANSTLPCSLRYANIECQFGFVSAILLGGGLFSQYNSSWPYFQGQIPWSEIVKLKKIIMVDLSFHNLTGPVLPSNISSNQLQNLQYLYLYSNKLTGPIPESVRMLKNMTFLQLYSNSLSGSIPPQIGELTLLQWLTLYSNSLNGTIPSEIGQLNQLTKLDLSSNLLDGEIPDSLSNLTSLQILIFQQNKLTGKIPSSLGKLKSLVATDLSLNAFEDVFPTAFLKLANLSDLFLSGNSLYGELPSNIWNAELLTNLDISSNYFNGTIPSIPKGKSLTTFSYSQNCFSGVSNSSSQRVNSSCNAFYAQLYPSSPPPPAPTNGTYLSQEVVQNKSKVNKLAIILPVVISFVFLLAFFTFAYMHYCMPKSIFDPSTKQTILALTKHQVQKATKNFTEVIGEGGYGIVYKAEKLINGVETVAVKRLQNLTKQGDTEFRREIKHLSKLHHRHLVQLMGFCDANGERILVYEYMENGSLFDHLHGKTSEVSPLPWETRIKIALQIASALKYLHFGLDVPLIHRDIKSPNILLGREWIAKISDFGLCKEAPLDADELDPNANVASTTLVRGSFGYLDPEYVKTSKLTDKSDVYSFGVVLLELVTGHEAIHEFQPLANWAHESMLTREKALNAVDKNLGVDYDLDEFYALVDVALSCTQESSAARPNMRDVAQALTEVAQMNAKSPSQSHRDTSENFSESFKKDDSQPSLSGSFQWTPNSVSQEMPVNLEPNDARV